MKNGIVKEDGRLTYYKNNVPYHAGAVKIDGNIYYVGRNGRVATGQHIVHREMTNGLLERGTYTFDEEGKLIEGSFRAPKKVTHHNTKSKSKSSHKKSSHRKHIFKLKKKQITLIICIGFAATLLIAFAFFADKLTPHKESDSHITSTKNITLPEFKEPVNLCTIPAQKLYKHEVSMEQLKEADVYLPFEFSYQLADTDGELYLSESANMSASKKYILAKSETSLFIDNLKTGTTYYYRADIGEESYTGSFQTAEGTRYLYIPGVYNTRDIGGYTTKDGNKIKQGMIIRGTEIDGLVEASYYLSHKDVENVMDQFEFVYDMDLREPWVHYGEYTSPFGEEVVHKFYKSPAYVNVFSSHNKDIVKDIFSDLAKEENYPMYLHCTYGADRTGTIIYLLQGLLGMSDEDMMREYQMSGLFLGVFADSTRMDSVVVEIEKFPGQNTSEKIEYFLTKEIGLSDSQLQSIRNILLEN